jgi:hypothetical protein
VSIPVKKRLFRNRKDPKDTVLAWQYEYSGQFHTPVGFRKVNKGDWYCERCTGEVGILPDSVIQENYEEVEKGEDHAADAAQEASVPV